MSEARIAGVDEAGRGAWAGNVVAAAVILPERYDLPGLTDSKKLNPAKRDSLFTQILTQAVCVRYAQRSAAAIDRDNIHQSTLNAMYDAICGLQPMPDQVLVDGKFTPAGLTIAARAIIGGDSSEPAIAAASIVAKVVRDRQLCLLDLRYPGYGFAQHKGYGTAAHQQALARLGVAGCHRKSYAPIAKLLSQLPL